MSNQKLNQALFLAAKECIHERFKNDPEQIKLYRDSVTENFFGKNYKDLSKDEILAVIDYFKEQSEKPAESKISRNQQKLLRFYQIHCAFKYCKWEKAIFGIEENSRILSGSELRKHVEGMHKKNIKLQNNIFRWMSETWINPVSHRFMIEGGHKKYAKNTANFHYEYLTQAQAMYLINRFGQMFMQLSKEGNFDADFNERMN